jgi:hypothetical protein
MVEMVLYGLLLLFGVGRMVSSRAEITTMGLISVLLMSMASPHIWMAHRWDVLSLELVRRVGVMIIPHGVSLI